MNKCKIEDCTKDAQVKGICHNHYMQKYRKAKREGKIQFPVRNKFQPNEFLITGDICFIRLYNQKGYMVGEALIDAEDYELAKNKKWHLAQGYASADGGKTSLAHVIMGHSSNRKILIDHISKDRLDNRKSNLRTVSKSQNSLNTKLRKDNKSGCRGISWDKERNKWFVRIAVNRKNIALGRYKDIGDAINAYNEAAKKYHGKFANITKT